MDIYLVQHAEAKSKEEDPERGLSDIGFANIRNIARFVKKLEIDVDTIFHSDKLRAKQTSEELSEAINSINGLKLREDIAPMDNISSIKNEVDKNNKNIMIVGHLPYLNKFASSLLSGNEEKNIISFQNG